MFLINYSLIARNNAQFKCIKTNIIFLFLLNSSMSQAQITAGKWKDMMKHVLFYRYSHNISFVFVCPQTWRNKTPRRHYIHASGSVGATRGGRCLPHPSCGPRPINADKVSFVEAGALRAQRPKDDCYTLHRMKRRLLTLSLPLSLYLTHTHYIPTCRPHSLPDILEHWHKIWIHHGLEKTTAHVTTARVNDKLN